jgi:hypothetical protein
LETIFEGIYFLRAELLPFGAFYVNVSQELNSLRCTFSELVRIPNQTTDYTPALTQVGTDLVLAWRATDQDHHITAMRSDINSPDPLASFGDQVVFSDTANGAVSLATYQGQAYAAWGGTDPKNLLNLMPLFFQS